MTESSAHPKRQAAAPRSIKIPKALPKMEANPRDDWTLEKLISVATKIGLIVKSPTRGSHYTFSSPHFDGNTTVPYKRPIKPFYVSLFASMCRAHITAEERNGDNDG